ncbi:30S ribosomal protein S5 [PVC group bacterium (ex Bugula neritina AB1)]|nr:30S ribosomal protein S5 [PVC group bacterium (ex Bugula neritina AB1)]
MRPNKHSSSDEVQLEERVVQVNRVVKVVTGGRRFSLNAFSVVGDGKGSVGFGAGKGSEVPDAIRKSIKNAKKRMTKIFFQGNTIPYVVEAEFCSARVILKPAKEGTGIIAGAAVRAVMEAVGIHDVVTKSLGSSNKANIVKATLKALKSLLDAKEVERLRGVKIYATS